MNQKRKEIFFCRCNLNKVVLEEKLRKANIGFLSGSLRFTDLEVAICSTGFFSVESDEKFDKVIEKKEIILDEENTLTVSEANKNFTCVLLSYKNVKMPDKEDVSSFFKGKGIFVVDIEFSLQRLPDYSEKPVFFVTFLDSDVVDILFAEAENGVTKRGNIRNKIYDTFVTIKNEEYCLERVTSKSDWGRHLNNTIQISFCSDPKRFVSSNDIKKFVHRVIKDKKDDPSYIFNARIAESKQSSKSSICCQVIFRPSPRGEDYAKEFKRDFDLLKKAKPVTEFCGAILGECLIIENRRNEFECQIRDFCRKSSCSFDCSSLIADLKTALSLSLGERRCWEWSLFTHGLYPPPQLPPPHTHLDLVVLNKAQLHESIRRSIMISHDVCFRTFDITVDALVRRKCKDFLMWDDKREKEK